jgi:osmoprotectant transport system permease protein
MWSVIAQTAVPRDITLGEWLGDPETWTGSSGILANLGDTVTLCVAVITFSVALAVPSAAMLAHRRLAPLASAWFVNVGRAIPTLAIAGLLVPVSLRAGYGFEPWPIFIALTLLTVPPMFLSTYTAITQVDPGAVDAARAMGFTERDVLLTVEVPLASSVIATGVRVAAVQVVATEPIRAFIGGDGLGRYVRDGIGQNNATLTLGGTILIAVLAGITGLLFSGLERLVQPRGVRRLRRGPRHQRGRHTDANDPDEARVDGTGSVDAAVGRLR